MKLIKSFIFSAAVFAFGAAAFADESPLSFHGMLRREVTAAFDKIEGEDDTTDPVFSTTARLSGYNLGLGPKTLNTRIDIKYAINDLSGITFRYDEDADDFFNSNNIKWAMYNMQLNNGMFDLSLGKLVDKHTGTKGLRPTEWRFDYGAAFAIMPVEGLAISARAASAKNNDDFTEDLIAFTAAYSNEYFSLQAGYRLDKTGYFGCTLNAVENLTFIVDGSYKLEGIKNDDGNDVFFMGAEIALMYRLNPVNFGMRTCLRVAEDNNSVELYPFVEVSLNDAVPGLSCGLDFAYVKSDKDCFIGTTGPKYDGYMGFTPEVTYRFRNSAFQVFYTLGIYDKDVAAPVPTAEKMSHAFGLGCMYNF